MNIALNALFPERHPDVWKQFRALAAKAPIIAHGINNSTELLPLGRGLDAQRDYIRRTLDLIEKETGVRSTHHYYETAHWRALRAAAFSRHRSSESEMRAVWRQSLNDG